MSLPQICAGSSHCCTQKLRRIGTIYKFVLFSWQLQKGSYPSNGWLPNQSTFVGLPQQATYGCLVSLLSHLCCFSFPMKKSELNPDISHFLLWVNVQQMLHVSYLVWFWIVFWLPSPCIWCARGSLIFYLIRPAQLPLNFYIPFVLPSNNFTSNHSDLHNNMRNRRRRPFDPSGLHDFIHLILCLNASFWHYIFWFP